MDREKFIQLFSNQQSSQAPLAKVLSHFLSETEANQILEQFESNGWIVNGQVLWSGIPREVAQKWANSHGLQTLTTAMGPLMDPKHPGCLRSEKNAQQWSNYVHGASVIFAWRIAQSEKVTLLSPPPPERFHPSGLSYYQIIEEPILRGLLGPSSVRKINIVHPTGKESSEFPYELWPNDRSDEWLKRFGSTPYNKRWRPVGKRADKLRLELKKFLNLPGERFGPTEQQKESGEHKITYIEPAYGILLLLVFLLLSKVPMFLVLGLSYLLFDKTWNENNATKQDRAMLETAESTSILNSARIQKVEPPTESFKNGAACQKIKAEKKARAKAQQDAAKRLKDEKKARVKAQQDAAKRLKDRKRALAKAQQDAAKRLKDEKKARVKAQQDAAKRLKDEKKARAKAQQDAAKRLKDKKKARAKAQQDAAKRLKDEKKARAKAQQDAAKRLKDEKKARVKAQQDAAKRLKDEKKARAKAQKEDAKRLKNEKRAEGKCA